jgi:formylmethanofuran--tetrahydromethanopterin N-formyltransferase
MPASTNHPLCPSLRGRVEGSLVPEGVGSIYEIVVNGVDEERVKAAMKAGIEAATGTGRVLFIGASNFGGKLGPYRIRLRELFR